MLFIQALVGKGEAPAGFILAISLWLWFTVLFANFAEAMAEGRGKAQADCLRKARSATSRPRNCMQPELWRQVRHGARLRACARATWCWSRPATSFPATAR